jgi:hypothetical protein
MWKYSNHTFEQWGMIKILNDWKFRMVVLTAVAVEMVAVVILVKVYMQ